MTGRPAIDLLHLPDCPRVDSARDVLRTCLGELGLTEVNLKDREGDFPSPSILVNGVDVMGASLHEGSCCRLDLPTREQVMRALGPARPTRS